MQQKPIDALSVRRSTKSDVPLTVPKGPKTQVKHQKQLINTVVSPRQYKRDTQTLSYSKMVGISFVSAWQARHFHLALVRTLFSIRAFVFSILPIVYFQLQSTVSLRPNELLTNLQSVTSTTQTGYYIALGGIVFAAFLFSWLADMVITPPMMQLTFLEADKRKLSLTQSLTYGISRIHYHFGIRLWHGLQIIIVFVISVLVLLISQQFAITLGQHLSYGLLAAIVILLLWSVEESIRWIQNGYLATIAKQFSSVLSLIIRQFLHHPLTYLGYGFAWLSMLGMSVGLVLLLVWGEITMLSQTSSFGLSVVILALATTLIYIVWTLWYGFSCSYWSLLVHERTPSQVLTQSIRVSREPSRLEIWPIIVVVTILVLLMLAYFIIAITSVDWVITSLQHVSSLLPKSLQIVLPKPN